jgi:GTP-binding protein
MAIATYLKSAVFPQDYPQASRPEIALVGRSNAGKSSLLNSMCSGTAVAKISSTPGKTRLLNFFDVGEHYRVVDLPGYGFAARDRKEREMWAQMIHDYLEIRLCLKGLVLICDVRRTWSDDEQSILTLAQKKNLQVACVLTKIDKLGKSDLTKRLDQWEVDSNQEKSFFSPISSLKNAGVKEFEKKMFEEWIKK